MKFLEAWFVAKARYDELIHDAEQIALRAKGEESRRIFAESQVSYFKEAVAGERARYSELLDKYTSLKLAGAVEVPKLEMHNYPTGVRRDPITAERDELKELIGEKCGTDSRKRGMMLKALAADRAMKVPDEKIREAIEHGIASSGVLI